MRIRREAIIDAAIALLDEVGLDGLTMRRLGQALNIQAPSLYWHFPNKEALIDAMADALIAGVAPGGEASGNPTAGDGGWEAAIRRIANGLRDALCVHRDGARLYAGTYVVTDNTLRLTEALIGALRAGGASPRTAGWGAFTLLDFVLGFTIEEQGLRASADRPAVDLPVLRRDFERMAAVRFPALVDAIPVIFDTDMDARFAFGVDVMVAGLRAAIDRGV